ncbi:putative signal peptide-containing protein [Cryptosporidium canis]|uniref:Signal peptide-containing protein n=1 Tax=Cryptosporidium canis TaxID=195482 RepID=A0ABQ8P6V5_9CRYT|nr:putative signal peptide-containing protein [Cryptosporidium canis]KAJ1610865.1 putative signal peptide-containing protein [Cryptosporidium canis]
MKHNGNLSIFVSKYIVFLSFIFFCDSSKISYVNSTVEKDSSNIGSALLLLYDVDNVILKHVGPGKTYINPEIVPLLASMDSLRKSKDSRILLPRIFSHGCGTAAKLSESKLIKPRVIDTNPNLNYSGDSNRFSIQIKDIGDAYLLNEVYFLIKNDQSDNIHFPIDIFKIFFADENELDANIPSVIPFSRVLERKSVYFDEIVTKLNGQESIFYKKFIQQAQRTIGGRPFSVDTIISNMDEAQKKTFFKKLLTKISSFPKVWPFDIRSEELPFIKDLVKYRGFVKGKIQFGTTILLLDDLVAHFNFGCVHEHFSEEYKVFIIVVRKFMPNTDIDNLSREFQKSIPVPIGTTPYSPFDIREVNSKVTKLLERLPEETHPDIFYKEIRNEFIYDSPTYPKCGYDISKPSPFYFLIVIECDILYNLIKLFIDDRMAEEVTYLLNISSYIVVITGRKSCEYSFLMVKHLITSGLYQWSNKIIPLHNLKGRSTDDIDEFSPSFSQYSKNNKKYNKNQSNQDRHIFMSKLYSRVPRSRTMTLRLDYHGDPGTIQYSDYTCFLNAPPKEMESTVFPSKSTKYRQLLNLQSDSKLSKFFGIPPLGEVKTITLVQKLAFVFNKIEGVLESTIKASSGSSGAGMEPDILSVHAMQSDDEYISTIDDRSDPDEDQTLHQVAAPKTGGSLRQPPAPPTIYPQASYSFLSIFYTVVETLKDEFPKDYIFCVGSAN